MVLMLLLLLRPRMLPEYPNEPWQYHTQDGPACKVALAPCKMKKMKSNGRCDAPVFPPPPLPLLSSLPLSPWRSQMEVWPLCRGKKKLYYTIRRARRADPPRRFCCHDASLSCAQTPPSSTGAAWFLCLYHHFSFADIFLSSSTTVFFSSRGVQKAHGERGCAACARAWRCSIGSAGFWKDLRFLIPFLSGAGRGGM